MGISRYRFDGEEKERVIFVPWTLPGDEVEVVVVEVQKRFLNAKLLKLLKPSPRRIEPRCGVFGQCGGCEWQHIPYDLQYKTKVEGALHALKRTGVNPQNIHRKEYPAKEVYSYRNRIQLRGQLIQGQAEFGYYAKGSRQFVPIHRCEIADEKINQALATSLREELNQRVVQQPEVKEHKVEIQIHPLQWKWNAPHASMGFRQVNESQNLHLQHYVGSQILDGAYVLDLFGGSGNLSKELAHRVKWVECVDLFTASNTDPHKPKNLSFSASDVSKWLTRKAYEKQKGYSKIDGTIQVILDPPRQGVAEQQHKIAKALDSLGASTLILVGCEVDAWARDVSRFKEYGWELHELAFIDFFPQTHHLESIAVFKK
jgi:tRNA/tmRNA/rRNA uracil-C5-methylase (TrmA/RlmC/RlmD family)